MVYSFDGVLCSALYVLLKLSGRLPVAAGSCGNAYATGVCATRSSTAWRQLVPARRALPIMTNFRVAENVNWPGSESRRSTWTNEEH